jgi:hypothetical protein
VPPKFNPLIDPPQTEVEVAGEVYRITTDFRQALKYFRMIADPDDDQATRTARALALFFDRVPRDQSAFIALVEALEWYLACGNPAPKRRPGQPTPSREVPSFDLDEDGGRIFAAFLQTYQINLRKVAMHWWVFCALLEGLPRDTHLAEVIDIRTRELPTGTGQEVAKAKHRLLKAKEHYALGKGRKSSDPMTSFHEFLKGLASR